MNLLTGLFIFICIMTINNRILLIWMAYVVGKRFEELDKAKKGMIE